MPSLRTQMNCNGTQSSTLSMQTRLSPMLRPGPDSGMKVRATHPDARTGALTQVAVRIVEGEEREHGAA